MIQAIANLTATPDLVALGYFTRSGITHFGKFICAYKTGYDYGSEAGIFASGRIEIWVDKDGEVRLRAMTIRDQTETGSGSMVPGRRSSSIY